MGWAEDRERLLSGGGVQTPPTNADRTGMPLRVSDLVAVVRVIDQDGDGTIPVVSWEQGADKRWTHVTRSVRVLTASQVEDARQIDPEGGWRVRVAVRRAGEGWLAVTDPLTGEVHEIQAQDAPFAWWNEGQR